uniref:Uncharacterized protein LOC8267302 n=1 Tax=Rhizophora mucronata TaxID=61149 RepID=A0A2P2L4I7_RHIMU
MVKINPPRILPSPRFADRDYELLEKVDVRYGFGWRTGTITKIFEGRRYNVYFRQGNEDRKLDHSEMRPHLEQVDGQTKVLMYYYLDFLQAGLSVHFYRVSCNEKGRKVED